MGPKTILFPTEWDFRQYVIQKITLVQRIVIFEDLLDHVVFFYGFTKDMNVLATKEPARKNMEYFIRTYQKLANEHHFHMTSCQNPFLKLELKV